MSTLASFLQGFSIVGLVGLAWCSKRDRSGSSGKAAQKNGKPKIPKSGKAQFAYPEKRAAQGDLASESTDDSCPALGSSSGSDTEASSSNSQRSPQSDRLAPRLEAPPGLALPEQLMKAAGRLNPSAEPYVPSAIPMALQGVLKKLSPEDAATVRHLWAVKGDAPSCVPGDTLQQVMCNISAKQSNVPTAETLVVLLNQAASALEGSNGKKGMGNRPRRSNEEVPWRRDRQQLEYPLTVNDECSLRSNLQKMAKYDSDCIFMVRKLNKLGLNSPIFLRDYFEQFGAVEDVFVTHAIDKNKDLRCPEKQRIRPAGIGFVVMKKAEHVTAILQRDEAQHTLRGVTVSVCKYEYRAPKEKTNKLAAPWGDRFRVPTEETKGASESGKT